MLRKHKSVTFKFRKEDFTICYHYYECTETKEVFTFEDVDEINMNQVYNQYREKYGVPFPEEIIAIREKYGISASKMSEILGLGANTYRLYETGDMPSVSNGRLILSVDNPDVFKEQIEASSHCLTRKEYDRIIGKVNELKEKKAENAWGSLFEEKIFVSHKPTEYNGYKVPSLSKIANVIGYFSSELDAFKTKVNKLLFYTDFLMYQKTAHSMTGITYKALPYGPVPAEYEKLYVKLCDDNTIGILPFEFNDGNYGEKIIGLKDIANDFSAIEMEVLNIVLKHFKANSTKEIVDISHDEPAWIENELSRGLISYQKYAYDLKAFKVSGS